MRPVPLWQFLIYLLGLITLAVILAGSPQAASAAGKGSPHFSRKCGEYPSVRIQAVVKVGPAYRAEYRRCQFDRKLRKGRSAIAVIKIGNAYTAERRLK